MAKITLTHLPKENHNTFKNEKIIDSESTKTTVEEFLLGKAADDDYNLYGIVDSARNEEVFRYLITGNVIYKSLFEGTMDVQSFGVSGFLVECKKESSLFQWMTTEVWGNSCCIFFTSKSSFDELFIHFQQFNRVYLEDDEVVLFRYYDPRVLRVYLPSCNHNEIDAFFGDVNNFFAESENPEKINMFTNGGETEALFTSAYKIINNKI